MADARTEIGKALESKMSPEHLEMLMNEVLAITKNAWANVVCKSCGQKQKVLCEIPDANAVTGSMMKLADQAWGRPAQADGADEEKIVFTRVVYLGADGPS